jgi:hypothetical protein
MCAIDPDVILTTVDPGDFAKQSEAVASDVSDGAARRTSVPELLPLV